jgi:hypothetical protein
MVTFDHDVNFPSMELAQFSDGTALVSSFNINICDILTAIPQQFF